MIVFEVDNLAADFGDELVFVIDGHGHQDASAVFVDFLVWCFCFDEEAGATDEAELGIEGGHIGDEGAFGIERAEASPLGDVVAISDGEIGNEHIVVTYRQHN